jgi:hypothetical protein
MGSSVQRFTRPETLSLISPSLLMDLLQRHRESLGECGFAVPVQGKAIDLDALAALLQSGADNVPLELLDVLWHAHELRHARETVQCVALAHRIDSAALLGMTVEDIVIWLFLNHPKSLLRVHAERASSRRHVLVCFAGRYPAEILCNAPVEPRVNEIGMLLDDALRSHCRGARVSQHVFSRKSQIEIVYGFGGSLSRIASANKDAVDSITFHPLEHVVVRIDRTLHLLHIAAEVKWLRQCLRQAVGKVFFGDETHFGDQALIYTLSPLLRDGARALVCPEIPEIKAITLIELKYMLPGSLGHVVTHNASDLRGLLVNLTEDGVRARDLVHAKFKVQCRGERRARAVTVYEGNRASYSRDDDHDLIERWLAGRGFMVGKQHAGRKSA